MRSIKCNNSSSKDCWDSRPNEKKEISVPYEADFLYAYATVSEYVAYRNTEEGSW